MDNLSNKVHKLQLADNGIKTQLKVAFKKIDVMERSNKELKTDIKFLYGVLIFLLIGLLSVPIYLSISHG